jgi:MFS family permease
MNVSVRTRLSMMMALIYAVQGAFWPLLALHLGDLNFSGRERSWVFATYPIAAIVTSLGAGAIVDRLMPSQRYVSICFGLASVLLAAVALGLPGSSLGVFGLFLGYWLITAPTYGIANSIAFRNLSHPGAEFGAVRLWGTVGWMVVGWVVSAIMAASGATRSGRGAFEAFWLASALAAGLAVFALFLPNTPPLAASDRSTSLSLVANLFRIRGVGIYLVTAFFVSLTSAFIYQALPPYMESMGLPRSWSATTMTLGQWPEIAALFGLPFLLRRWGVKITLTIGLAAWLIRFATLAIRPTLWLAIAGIPLHGIGIACFTVGGQIFLDGRAPADRRAGAQAVQMMLTSGLGAMLGSFLTGELQVRFGSNSPTVFLVPCSILVGLIVFFILGFRPDVDEAGRLAIVVPVRLARLLSREETRPVAAGVRSLAMESADG